MQHSYGGGDGGGGGGGGGGADAVYRSTPRASIHSGGPPTPTYGLGGSSASSPSFMTARQTGSPHLDRLYFTQQPPPVSNMGHNTHPIRTPPSAFYTTSPAGGGGGNGSSFKRGSFSGPDAGITHVSNIGVGASFPPYAFSAYTARGQAPLPSPQQSGGGGGGERKPNHSASPTSEAGQSRQSGITPLRRGQACLSCRKRKLKCDAVRPVCGTCVKSRKAAALANHISPVPEGDCMYGDGPSADETGISSSSTTHDAQHAQRHSSSAASSSSTTTTTTTAPTANKRQRIVGADASVRDHRSSSNDGDGRRGAKEHEDETAEQRVARLEDRVMELEEKLRIARNLGAANAYSADPSVTPHRWRSRASSREPADSDEAAFRPAVPIISMLSPLSGREERHRMRYFQRPTRIEGFGGMLHDFKEAPYVASSLSRAVSLGDDREEQSQPSASTGAKATNGNGMHVEADAAAATTNYSPTDEEFMQLLWPGWSSDLPSAETVTSLCEIFFRLHPLRTLIYKPSFMSGLLLPPRHPHRPHDSLIHAVLCAAADLSPYHESSSMVSGVRDRFVVLLSDPFSRPNLQQSQSVDMLTFKEFHLSKARQKVERSLITDFRNPLDWVASCVLTCYVLWNDGRFVEAYFLSGFMVRAAAPSGLDKLPSRHYSASGKVRNTPGIFGDAQGLEEHERRIVFWHIFLADQYTSGPPSFYENMLSEQAILTHLPCKLSDFFAGNDVPPNPQALSAGDLFTSGHLDEFTLHLKSAVLLRRASALANRSQLSRSKPSGLAIIDRHIDDFLASFPPTTLNDSTADGLNAYANISLALVYLHEPYLDKTALCTIRQAEPKPKSSNGRVLRAVEQMMGVLHELMNSSLDFALLHAQMFLTWSVCARMMGKDLVLLQQRLQSRSHAADNGSATAAETKSVAADEPAALARVLENLDLIVMALRRGGIKSNKAKRCSELVSSVRSGHLHESYLTHLLYLDGVIPVDENETNERMPPADLASSSAVVQPMPFDVLMHAGLGGGGGGGDGGALSGMNIDLPVGGAHTLTPGMDGLDVASFGATAAFQAPSMQEHGGEAQQQTSGLLQAEGGTESVASDVLLGLGM